MIISPMTTGHSVRKSLNEGKTKECTPRKNAGVLKPSKEKAIGSHIYRFIRHVQQTDLPISTFEIK